MSTESEMLHRRILGDRETVARSLRSELRALKFRVEQALQSLDAGRQLDGHVIHNSSMITADIARWNLIVDLMPYVEGMP